MRICRWRRKSRCRWRCKRRCRWKWRFRWRRLTITIMFVHLTCTIWLKWICNKTKSTWNEFVKSEQLAKYDITVLPLLDVPYQIRSICVVSLLCSCICNVRKILYVTRRGNRETGLCTATAPLLKISPPPRPEAGRGVKFWNTGRCGAPSSSAVSPPVNISYFFLHYSQINSGICKYL